LDPLLQGGDTFEVFRKAKVDKDDVTLPVNENIGSLDVDVYNTALVQLSQGDYLFREYE